MSLIKKAILLSLIVVCLGLSFLIIDYMQLRNNDKPVFAIEASHYKDGGSIHYIGFFYQIIKYHKICVDFSNGESWYYESFDIKPWFVEIYNLQDNACESQKYKAESFN